MAEVPIIVFNAAPVAISISANGNTEIPVEAASLDWQPGTYPKPAEGATAKMLMFSGNENKTDGVLGETSNNMRIIVGGSSGNEITFTVDLPNDGSIRPRDALQMYVFWNDQNKASWVFLDEGQPLAGAMAIPS